MSRQKSGLTDDSTSSAPNIVEKASATINNLGEKFKEMKVGREERKKEYKNISNNLESLINSEVVNEWEEYRVIEKMREELKAYERKLRRAQTTANNFSKYINGIENIKAQSGNLRNIIIGQIKAHYLSEENLIEKKYLKLIDYMINNYVHIATDTPEKINKRTNPIVRLSPINQPSVS
uniref:DUF148 domain-containing protein n=1 Tax=Meloidogyne hapla TaxID=6305 RepID=A0A1I8AY98_MELHA